LVSEKEMKTRMEHDDREQNVVGYQTEHSLEKKRRKETKPKRSRKIRALLVQNAHIGWLAA